MADQRQAGLRFHRKDKPVRLRETIPAQTKSVVLRDEKRAEHVFGGVELFSREALVFTYVATYTPDGALDRRWPAGVRDQLTGGYELVELSHGPTLSPRARFAIAELAEDSAIKGFAFDYEKTMAVRTLLALQRAGERLPPDEVELVGAMNGLSLREAAKLREFVERVSSGGRFQPAIRLDDEQYERFLRYWDTEAPSG
jgi:hypothetical protein